MIYFDGIHLASPDLNKLHEFAASIGLKRCWFEGVRKGHPHYDITSKVKADKVIAAGAIKCSTKELIINCYMVK